MTKRDIIAIGGSAGSGKVLKTLIGALRLGAGARENLARPSIDALFRPGSLSHGPRAVGVILTGLMNDGASGLYAIKQMGGTAVVQHPLDAEEDSMPKAALEAVEADHVARAGDLAEVLTTVAGQEASTLREAATLSMRMARAASA